MSERFPGWQIAAALVLVGCGDTTSATTNTSDGGATPSGDASVTNVSAQDGGAAYTLESCTTTIAADVPAFYRKYFKCVTIANSADGVSISWNGLPPHNSYYFGPGNANYTEFDVSRGAQYKANPNTIAGRTKTMTVPNAPAARGLTVTSALVDRTANTNAAEYRGGAVGVAIDSVSIFNDQAGPGDNIDLERFTFDSYNAHPTQTGDYHYHTTSTGPLEVLRSLGMTTSTTPGEATVELYGLMCDGTLVLGCTELDGTAPSASSLDAQSGHVGDVKDADGTLHFATRYHTHVCPKRFAAHPYTPEIQYYSTCTVK